MARLINGAKKTLSSECPAFEKQVVCGHKLEERERCFLPQEKQGKWYTGIRVINVVSRIRKPSILRELSRKTLGPQDKPKSHYSSL